MGKISTKTKKSFQAINRAAKKGPSKSHGTSNAHRGSTPISLLALVGALSGLLISLQPHTALAGSPYVFSYGGRLALPSGESVKGPVNLEIKFYRSASGGTPLPVTPVVKTGVLLTDGVFQADLSELAAAEASLVFSPTFETWVEVSDLTNKTVYPRQRLTAVPYAFKVPVDQTTVNFDGDGRLTVGTIDMAKVNGLEAALATRNAARAVSMTDVTGLQSVLDGKVNSNATVGGDVSGYLSTEVTVNKIKGVSVDTPATNKYLKYNGTNLVWDIPAAGGTGDMLKANNLSDLTSPSAARTHLELGSLATSSEVTSTLITNGTIVDADISASAAIADTKLATISTAGRVSGSAINAGTIGGATAIDTSGAITTTGAVTAAGAITGTGNVVVNGTGYATTELRFNDNDNTNYVGFKSPSVVGANFVWTLPAADGTGGQFLKTDGSGTLSWHSIPGGGDLLAANNLGDLANAGTARTNLGLNTLATLAAVGSTEITNDSIMNADINASAAIATSKLSGAVTSIASHGLGSLAILSTVGSTDITNDSIVDADINSTAAIAQSKISGLTTALSGKEPTIITGTISDFYRGDKSWQDFNTAARGAVSITAPLTYNSSTGVFGLGQASGVANGYLSSSDFTVFNNKQAAITTATTVDAGTVTTAQQNGVEIKPYNSAAGNTGELRFDELAANGTNYVGFKAPDVLASNKIWTLPAADGTSGQLLKTDGSGALGWVTGGAGSVTSVNLTAPAAGITVSGGPITSSGSITLALEDDLAAVEALATTGGVERTGANTWGTYSVTAAGKAILDDDDSTAQRTTLGLGSLATSNAVGSSEITNDSIMDADINASAAIADTKLATISTAGKVSGSAITSGTIAGTTNFNTSGTITTSGAITGQGMIVNSGSFANELRFNDDNNSHYVGFKAPSTVSSNLIWTLPSNGGTNGQVLTTDSSGFLSWASAVPPSNSITSAEIFDGTITNADIANGAISDSKLTQITTAAKVNGSAITGDLAVTSITTTTGNVGIGTATPQAKLQVEGQMVARQHIVSSVDTVDFNNGNAQFLLNPPGAAITLSNMMPGGAYTLVIRSSSSYSFDFTASCATLKFSPANGNTNPGSDTIYSIQKFNISGTDTCYISWITGL